MEEMFTYIVVGGGIAGVSCAETLSQLAENENILLVIASDIVKSVTNFRMVSKTLSEFDVIERPMAEMHAVCPNVTIRKGCVNCINYKEKKVLTAEGHTFLYDKICICAGANPQLIATDNPAVIGIRDIETIQEFQKRLSGARRVVIVGNGGIATELVHEINYCEVVWVVRSEHISQTFVDEAAARFFLPHVQNRQHSDQPVKRTKYSVEPGLLAESLKNSNVASYAEHDKFTGSALGPDWATGLKMAGDEKKETSVRIIYNAEVKELHSASHCVSRSEDSKIQDWSTLVELSTSEIIGCDFVVSATGVTPNVHNFLPDSQMKLGDDGGILVDGEMRTGEIDVYAAGDVCTAGWSHSPHWLQMRLWSQARQFGIFAAKCMVAHYRQEDVAMDFCFELFAHVTHFFNFKIVLLGKFKAQGFENDHELLVRHTPGIELAKVILRDGRVQGALLVGETELEETIENLILNQMDISSIKDGLLDPEIDIQDYFD